jgi:hypothetical protein
MPNSLELRFETGGRPGVTRPHDGVFRLYSIEGSYPLPVPVLQTAEGIPRVTLQEVAIAEVRNATGASDLTTWLRYDWNTDPRPTSIVSGRQQMLTDASLPVRVIQRDLARQLSGGPLRAEVTWKVNYGDAGGPRTLPATVVLEFAPPDEPPPPPVPDAAPDGKRLRDTVGRSVHSGFAAVDFGTSASTVTVHDSRKMTSSTLDADQADCLREGILGLIKDNPPADDLDSARDWLRLLGLVVVDVLQKAPATVDVAGVRTIDDLAERLRAAGAAEQGLLNLVCLAIEKAQAGISPKLQGWLAPRLHECYDRAFQVPALSQLNLKRVGFGTGADRFQTPSSVRKATGTPVGLVFCTQSAADFPDLKRSLGKREQVPDLFDESGAQLTTDDLIARLYYLLVTRAEEFSAFPNEQPDDPLPPLAGIPALNELIVTYPTTTPPTARDQLAKLVQDSLDVRKVVCDYDEGVAAGLFFVMRDFGGNRSVGIEALRARSRHVADSSPPAWEQNIMVIDIGGGTTDIALLRLTLTDRTPDMPAVPAHVPGRYYVLRPEVLGSTGHPQLGGDYLTLKVFYWLKATIIDALLDNPSHAPGRSSLKALVPASLCDEGDAVKPIAKSVLRHGVKETLGESNVTEALRKIVPTHSTENTDKPQLTEAFKQLWEWAEQAKHQLGAGQDYVRHQDQLKEALVDIVPVESPDMLDNLIPADGIRLDPGDFETLAYPVFEKMIRLAKPVLFQKSWNHRLDRVMLSGRGSAMPVLRTAVVAELAAIRAPANGAEGADRSLSWNPAAITVEQRLAKQVTSLGACWAHSISSYKLAAPQDAASRLKLGRTEIGISVENLFINLPCDFKLKGLEVELDELLNAGTPFEELNESGLLGVRSDWKAMPSRFEVHRPIDEDAGESIQWGRFVLDDEAAAEKFIPDPATWLGQTERDIPAKVMASVEMGHDLRPSINLCNGAPHHVVSGRSLELLPELPDSCLRQDGRGDVHLIKLPWDIVAVGGTSRDGSGDEKVVFEAWDGEQGGTEMFTTVFHEQASMESPDVMGCVAELPLAPTDGAYPEYAFFAVDGGDRRPLGTLPLPGAWAPRATYRATLDRRGRLRIHRGQLPYWPAGSLRDVQDRPGSVRSLPLKHDVPFSNPTWNPFSGRH